MYTVPEREEEREIELRRERSKWHMSQFESLDLTSRRLHRWLIADNQSIFNESILFNIHTNSNPVMRHIYFGWSIPDLTITFKLSKLRIEEIVQNIISVRSKKKLGNRKALCARIIIWRNTETNLPQIPKGKQFRRRLLPNPGSNTSN